MSNYIENSVNQILHGNKFAIEHKDKPGWFLFDVTPAEDRIEIIWSKNLNTCLKWSSVEKAEDELRICAIHLDRVNIIDTSNA